MKALFSFLLLSLVSSMALAEVRSVAVQCGAEVYMGTVTFPGSNEWTATRGSHLCDLAPLDGAPMKIEFNRLVYVGAVPAMGVTPYGKPCNESFADYGFDEVSEMDGNILRNQYGLTAAISYELINNYRVLRPSSLKLQSGMTCAIAYQK